MRYCLVICISFFITQMYSQEKKAYQIFSADSLMLDYGQMFDSLKEADIILFGELHNNPICHWLQLELLEDLNAHKSVTVGLEMIERDNQEIFAQYMSDSITHAELGFASQVYKQGVESLDSLTANEKSWMTPLPFPYDKNLPGYKKMMAMFDDPTHANENLPKAQAIKDATMAHFILEHRESNHSFLHLNGSYHSDNYEGIVWYLNKQDPDLKIMTISSKEQQNILELDQEYKGIADYIIVIPVGMTKTY